MAEKPGKLNYNATIRLGRVFHCGYSDGDNPLTSPWRTPDRYSLAYLFNGKGFYRDANGVTAPVHVGDMLLSFPGLRRKYGPLEGQPWNEFWITFRGPVFDTWLREGLLDMRRPIHHLEPVDEWLQRFQSTIATPRRSPILEVCRVQEALGQALIGSQVRPSSHADLRWESQACALLESDAGMTVNLPHLAEMMGQPYETFRKRFTELKGVSPGLYRRKHIIQRACELLRQPDMSNRRIAEAMGFADEFHFSHQFKRLTGRSPRKYRESLARQD